jgi:membrane protease YdiL (CAAX protease family)
MIGLGRTAIAPPSTDARSRAWRGLAIYFAVLIPPSVAMYAVAITYGVKWAAIGMFIPAVASSVARLVLHQPFSEIGFRLRNRRVLAWIGFCVAAPIAIGAIAYGTAWTAGLATFSPHEIGGASTDTSGSGILLLTIAIVQAATIVTLITWPLAFGEEIGWRGYMLPRLIDAGVPHPLAASGLIWGLWHVPLVIGGVYYADSPSRIVSSLILLVAMTAGGIVYGRIWLDTGSIWPVVALHAAWNAVIGGPFDEATSGMHADLWIGESGILVAVVLVVLAVGFTRAHAKKLAPPAEPRRHGRLAHA